MRDTWQHFIAGKKSNDTKAKEVSQGNEHIQLQPKYTEKNENTWKKKRTS